MERSRRGEDVIGNALDGWELRGYPVVRAYEKVHYVSHCSLGVKPRDGKKSQLGIACEEKEKKPKGNAEKEEVYVRGAIAIVEIFPPKFSEL